MAKHNYSLLIKDSLPYLIKIRYLKQRNDRSKVTSNVKVSNGEIWPALSHMLIYLFVGLFNDIKVGKFNKKYFGCDRKFDFKVPKKWKRAQNSDSFLQIWTR